MDVVKTNISSLGGIVDVASEIGIGTKFTITMPVTLAIMPALMVSVDSETYTIALNTVAEAIVLNETDINSVMNTDTMTLRGQTLPLCRLDYYFNIYRPGPIPPNSKIVIASLGNRRLGLVVDSIDGQQDIIIKPLGTSMKNSGCFAGVTDIGDKKLALVIDTVAVIEEFFASREDNKQVLQSF
jgi:two-component system chemotaxis sensor kinase CheA